MILVSSKLWRMAGDHRTWMQLWEDAATALQDHLGVLLSGQARPEARGEGAVVMENREETLEPWQGDG